MRSVENFNNEIRDPENHIHIDSELLFVLHVYCIDLKYLMACYRLYMYFCFSLGFLSELKVGLPIQFAFACPAPEQQYWSAGYLSDPKPASDSRIMSRGKSEWPLWPIFPQSSDNFGCCTQEVEALQTFSKALIPRTEIVIVHVLFFLWRFWSLIFFFPPPHFSVHSSMQHKDNPSSLSNLTSSYNFLLMWNHSFGINHAESQHKPTIPVRKICW